MNDLLQALAAYAATCECTCTLCGCEVPEANMCDGCGHCHDCCACPSPEPETDEPDMDWLQAMAVRALNTWER